MKTSERIGLLSRRAVSVITIAFITVPAVIQSKTPAVPPTRELVQHGAYCARAGDCAGCHTLREELPFAGGRPFVLSVGRVYSTNITPDLETGIGHYNMDDFVKALREGKTEDGQHLFPAMPYPSYARLSQEDLSALYAYFMKGLKPVHNPNHPAKLSWPLGSRFLLSVWNALYLKKGEYAADLKKNASWNRGAYLVQGLGHCGDCHTPRGIGGQVKAGSEQSGRQYLAGATIDNWYASALTGDPETGLNAWSKDEIVEYLGTGHTARVAASGVMAHVINKSTQYLTDGDQMAIAEYLKSLPSSNRKGQSEADSGLQASAASAATRALSAGDSGMRGSRVYLDNCNACHGSDGSGAIRIFPNLAKNEGANSQNPISLIHIVLAGSSMPSTHTAPSEFAMPDFGWRLRDAEVADVLSFVRGSWGNHAAEVSRKEVGRVRKTLDIEKTVQ